MRSRHREFAPPQALDRAVKCLWHDSRPGGGGTFDVLPDGYAEIIFHVGDGCCMAHGGHWQSLPSPFIMGLLDGPVTLRTQGHFEVFAIRCYPWVVFDLLGLPADKGVVHLHQHPIAQLHWMLDQHLRAGRIDRALARVEEWLLHRQSALSDEGVLARAGAVLTDAHGTLPVSAVAAAAHATVRTLERRFKQSSGHTVKDVSGLMRFEQVRNRLVLAPHTSLAALARELGYTDQSHLSREFRRYSGTTPAAFARQHR